MIKSRKLLLIVIAAVLIGGVIIGCVVFSGREKTSLPASFKGMNVELPDEEVTETENAVYELPETVNVPSRQNVTEHRSEEISSEETDKAETEKKAESDAPITDLSDEDELPMDFTF